MTTTATHSNTLSSRLSSSGLGARALVPASPGWEGARQAWNLAVDQQPAAVVFPETAADVVSAVGVAAGLGLSVVVQGTGHGAASYDDLSETILVRTNRMRALEVSGGRARVEAGSLWGEVALAAGALDMAGLAGSSPDVGVVGYSLGGGIGWLSRRFGLATNAIRSIDLVTADGGLRRVDAGRDPELFWAMRGGGAGFGAVTGLEFDLVPVSHVYAGTLAWDASRATEILGAWADWTAHLDDTVTSILKFLNLPDLPFVPEVFRGRRMMTLGAAQVGDVDAGAASIDQMRRIARPDLDTFAVIPASDLVRLNGDPEGPTAGIAHHTLLGGISDGTIDALVRTIGSESDSPLVSVEIRHLGGALGRPAEHGGVLSHIDAPYAVNAVGTAHDTAQTDEARHGLDALIDALLPWQAGSYLNFAERPSDEPFDSGTNAALADIKSRIDPDRVFKLRTNQRYTANQPGTKPRKHHS